MWLGAYNPIKFLYLYEDFEDTGVSEMCTLVRVCHTLTHTHTPMASLGQRIL